MNFMKQLVLDEPLFLIVYSYHRLLTGLMPCSASYPLTPR